MNSFEEEEMINSETNENNEMSEPEIKGPITDRDLNHHFYAINERPVDDISLSFFLPFTFIDPFDRITGWCFLLCIH